MTLETVATEQPQPSPSPQALQLPGIAADIDERSDLSDGSIDVSVEEYFKALPPPNPSGMNPAKKRAKSVSSDGSSVAISPEPVVISTSITTQNIRELTELLQTSTYSRFCISTVFDIEPPTSTGGCPAFTAILRFMRNNTVVHEERTPDCYPNKKMAKEVVAGIGIAALPSLIQGMTEDAPLPEEKLDEEDWVSILHMFCQARHVLPQYTHFSPQPQRRVEFSCEVVLPNELGLAGTDDRIFGDKHQYFRNKKIAKCAAAKEAVIWIRDQPEAFLKDNLTRNTPSKNLASPNKGLVPKGGKIVLPKRAGSVEAVALVCPRLGMSMPEYRLEQDPSANSLYDICGVVKRLKGGKNVMIGPIKGIHGKKNAKERMADSILRWLSKEADKMEVKIVRGDF